MAHSKHFGATVDIGTSQLTIHLLDLKKQNLLAQCVLRNPQSPFGLDVVSRAKHAVASENNARKLSELVRGGVIQGLQIAGQEAGVALGDIQTMVVVGNTVMHHLFYGLPVDDLLTPPYEIQTSNELNMHTGNLGILLGDGAVCYSPPLIGSFVGCDAIAVALASGLMSSTETTVVADVGTNTEIMIGHKGNLLITSAASGPAFEGMSLDCGMPADEGAIRAVQIDTASHRPRVDIIGHGKPMGVCGTGAVSALGALLDSNLLNSEGSLARHVESTWLSGRGEVVHYILVQATDSGTGRSIYISQIDIRMIQQSKAAIFAAIELLVNEANISADDVERFLLTGAFGSDLNISDAIKIGLFPQFQNARVDQIPGGASSGADMILLNPELRDAASDIAKNTDYVDLMDNSEFEFQFSKAQLFPGSQ
ncbi:MAG: ASKHA domain-containing protein [Candidatus Thorarchaeota archaeon]